MKTRNLYITIGAIILAVVLFITAVMLDRKIRETKNVDEKKETENNKETEIVIGEITEEPETVSDDLSEKTVGLPDNAPEIIPAVVSVETEDEEIEITVSEPENDYVETEIKSDDFEKDPELDSEVINDYIIEEKEKAAEEEKKEEDIPVTVISEKKVTDVTPKPVVTPDDEKPDDGKQNDKKSDSGYASGSDEHPFVPPVDMGSGKIYDVDDIVGEGEDRPGEGIHF